MKTNTRHLGDLTDSELSNMQYDLREHLSDVVLDKYRVSCGSNGVWNLYRALDEAISQEHAKAKQHKLREDEQPIPITLPHYHEDPTSHEPAQLGEVGAAGGGFERVEFKDHYKHSCSLQMSSICLGCSPGESAVWLGRDDASPEVLHSDAARLGVKTNQKCGWVPYPLPEGVSISTRMHLNREQVEALVNHLQTWLFNGTFEL